MKRTLLRHCKNNLRPPGMDNKENVIMIHIGTHTIMYYFYDFNYWSSLWS